MSNITIPVARTASGKLANRAAWDIAAALDAAGVDCYLRDLRASFADGNLAKDLAAVSHVTVEEVAMADYEDARAEYTDFVAAVAELRAIGAKLDAIGANA